MLASSNIISKRLNNLQFGYYDPEEIRKLSVKEIKNPKAFDQLNNPIKGIFDLIHDRWSIRSSFGCPTS